LIGEVSKLNIVWGAEVKGTVSMRLKNVPWDQALDVVLEANNLGMRREGNIIWVTTRAKIKQLEKEEEDKRKAELERIKEERERIKEEQAALEEAKALQPLLTEYIPVDFANADTDVKPHIESIKSDRGSIIVDKRTNTIIMTDIASIIEKAKNLVKEFDAPVKQIMIEARIVEASTKFTRDLGVQWTSIQRRWQTRAGMGWGTDPTAFAQSGDASTGASFSSNAPTGWASNIGVSFAQLTSGGLGTLALNASLALAEAEGTIKVISAPKVIASNNEEATISRGSTFYLPAADNVEPKEVKAVLSLKVKPTVSARNYVTMEVSVLDEAETATGKTGKDITTKLIVRSGDTIVIGGIYSETKSEDESRIPGLSRIPFLGWLFKAKSKLSERSELLIFLTPTVLPPLRKGS
jgi:type IV pilus assembly protein PilQ